VPALGGGGPRSLLCFCHFRTPMQRTTLRCMHECSAAGAQSHAQARRILFRDGRPPLRYDVLSVNCGITPDARSVPGALEWAVPVKPIDR
jgi:hypothetical protein